MTSSGGARVSTVRMFVNGQAMRGGSLHAALAGAEFLGAVQTAARYRFRSFGDFPGLLPVAEGGAHIAGELYEVDYATLRDRLLPGEPAELELSVIELADGSGSCSVVVRAGETGGTDITAHGSWAAARAAGAA
jgi:gamma-glutamylcyclotransferase (GGCT)/AIG2-like uncharacterized protein YtfP